MPNPRSSLNCDLCSAREHCFFQRNLRGELAAEMESARRSWGLAKGELVYHEGDTADGVWLLCAGKVKLYRLSPEGKQLTTRIAYPGDLFGHGAFFADGVHDDFAEALESTVAAFLDRRFVSEMLTRESSLSMQFVSTLAVELDSAESLAMNLAYATARDRLLGALHTVRRQRGTEQRGPANRSGIHLRRQDLAQLSGLTIETTVRLLKELEREGEVELDGKWITFAENQAARVAA